MLAPPLHHPPAPLPSLSTCYSSPGQLQHPSFRADSKNSFLFKILSFPSNLFIHIKLFGLLLSSRFSKPLTGSLKIIGAVCEGLRIFSKSRQNFDCIHLPGRPLGGSFALFPSTQSAKLLFATPTVTCHRYLSKCFPQPLQF